MTYTEVYEQHGDWWIGWCEDVPGAIVQERTLEEAKASMQEVIPLILDVQAEIGKPGANLLKYAGSISPEHLDAMERAIEEGCERIEEDESHDPIA